MFERASPKTVSEFPNPFREEREPSKGEQEVVAGEYLLTLFRFLRIPIPRKADVAAIKRTGALLQRKYPVILKIVDYYGRLVQSVGFWRSK